MRKIIITLLFAICISCTACSSNNEENETTMQSKEKVVTDNKWVKVPTEPLKKAGGSGIEVMNPIELNLFGTDYYVVNSYNRRKIKIDDGIEFVRFGEYKVTADKIEYYTDSFMCEEPTDILTIIAYDSNDKIIGYSFISVSKAGNDDTVGEEKYTATTVNEITIKDVEEKCEEIFGKSMFNEALAVNENVQGIESKNNIFTKEVFKYIKFMDYYKGTLDNIEEMETVTINDAQKISQVFEILIKMEFEETDSKTANFEEEILFGLSNSCSFSMFLAEDTIQINMYDIKYRYKMTDENKKEIEQIRELFK